MMIIIYRHIIIKHKRPYATYATFLRHLKSYIFLILVLLFILALRFPGKFSSWSQILWRSALNFTPAAQSIHLGDRL